MAEVPRGAPKGKKSNERFEDITVDDLTVSTGLTLGTTDALTVDTINSITGKHLTITGADGYDVIVKLGDDDGNEEFRIQEVDGDNIFYVDSDKSIKLLGEVSTRNTADNSMYYQIAASSGHERPFKVAYEVVANDGGYFDALYANAKVASTSTPSGEIRASEHKVTIEGNCAAGAVATGVYAKINVSGASAEVSQAYGIDVLLEEESSGTITAGTGIRVQGGAGAIHYGIDISGDYGLGALKVPFKSGAGVTDEVLAASFGIAEGAASDARFVGIHKDTSDSNKLYPVYIIAGEYVIGAALTAAS